MVGENPPVMGAMQQQQLPHMDPLHDLPPGASIYSSTTNRGAAMTFGRAASEQWGSIDGAAAL